MGSQAGERAMSENSRTRGGKEGLTERRIINLGKTRNSSILDPVWENHRIHMKEVESMTGDGRLPANTTDQVTAGHSVVTAKGDNGNIFSKCRRKISYSLEFCN